MSESLHSTPPIPATEMGIVDAGNSGADEQ